MMVKLFCMFAGLEERVFFVTIHSSRSVGHLKKSIQAKKPWTVTGCAHDLVLFLAKKDNVWLDEASAAALKLDEHGHPLGLEKMWPTRAIKSARYFGEEFQPDDGHVHVLVVVPNAYPEWSLRLRKTSELELFAEMASKSRNSAEVRDVADMLMRIHEDSNHFLSFSTSSVLLENSLNADAKTQLAFKLMATEAFDLFYVVCSGPGELNQQVFAAFEDRSATLKMCLEQDETAVGNGSVEGTESLMLYSFIYAALCGNDKFYADKKPRWAVRAVLEKRRKNKTKPFVFFLDNFPCLDDLEAGEKERKMAQMVLNVLRSLRIPVVVAAHSQSSL
ncbi:crinkler (CRN) family protein, putative [Phytophthora infestans T30-4]|uniref:Crinkler (CRN) family protein, putative n=1 Tax=Phytophthora infestans (strain T30-4) TaxID=403677 RepID=D0NKL0_PHYIT|nr:crinkler (CRN) family protein, putative [Phytophthora infestans T30-4]EEY60146.1 crinkler (CRN) family protein, putative [Phytophthora infestans T30-4]|eukprot:XP_002900353.1 crinkler (CRN) family protein, putative [Phytophthora infestans T30-4]